MSLLKLLGGGGIEKLARQLNIDPGIANELTRMLAPTIGSAAKKRAASGGLDGLLGQLKGEGNARFFDDPESAATSEAREDGESFLESLLGSRDATRSLASEAAARAGASARDVENFLPALAAMAKGGLQKKTPDAAIDQVQNQLNSMLGRSSAEPSTAGDAGPDAGPDSLMGAIGSLLGGGSKPTAVDPGAGKPSHVDLHGGKPAAVSFGLVSKPTAVEQPAPEREDAWKDGFSVDSIASMFDEDDDGSPLDDILGKLMS